MKSKLINEVEWEIWGSEQKIKRLVNTLSWEEWHLKQCKIKLKELESSPNIKNHEKEK